MARILGDTKMSLRDASVPSLYRSQMLGDGERRVEVRRLGAACHRNVTKRDDCPKTKFCVLPTPDDHLRELTGEYRCPSAAGCVLCDARTRHAARTIPYGRDLSWIASGASGYHLPANTQSDQTPALPRPRPPSRCLSLFPRPTSSSRCVRSNSRQGNPSNEP